MGFETATSPAAALSLLLNNRNPSWWRDPGLRRLVFWQICIMVAQMTAGYDESIVGSLQTMKPWVQDIDSPDASKTGLISTIVFIGGFIGAFIAPPTADRFGRRAAIGIGCAFMAIGAVIQAAAQGSGIFIGGRLIVGLGISFTCCAGPSLINELAHPRMRGTIVSMFNVLWYVGSIIAVWTSFGTGFMTRSSWSWQIPSLIQAVPGAVVLCMLSFIPESSRWLYSRDRVDEARQVLSTYHANGSTSDALVEFETHEISSTVALGKISTSTPWKQLLRSPANRKRFGICIAVALLTLWNGQGVISYYVFYLDMLVPGTLVIYMCFPETKGFSLEELAALFEESEVVTGTVLEEVESGVCLKGGEKLSVKSISC